MHKCAAEGDAEGLQGWLTKGFSMDQMDVEGWVPVHYAAWWVDFTCVRGND